VRERSGLGSLSAERLRQELLRLLVAPRAVEMIGCMLDYGVLIAVLRAVVRPVLLARVAQIQCALKRDPDPILRLAALAVEVPEDADNLWRRLRLSNSDHARLIRAAAARSFAAAGAVSEAVAKARLYGEGEDAYRDLVLLSWAWSGAPASDDTWLQRWALPQRWAAPAFPLDGDDVIALGIPAGPRVGAILRALEAWWIAGGFSADETALRGKLRELIRS
jgi:poly(A) polymerase